jgi:indolepyruvate ferredoxin oxidoreductase alpha subunit
VAWKSVVGTNVASDALSNVASGGVTGGALIILGEDYGEGSSIMQERTHAFAMKSQIWLLDPGPNLTAIVDMVEKGFELSEASNTPVMLELRVRACHVTGSFVARDNRRPKTHRAAKPRNRRSATDRIVLPPANFLHEQEKIEKRWPAGIVFPGNQKLNELRNAIRTISASSSRAACSTRSIARSSCSACPTPMAMRSCQSTCSTSPIR